MFSHFLKNRNKSIIALTFDEFGINAAYRKSLKDETVNLSFIEATPETYTEKLSLFIEEEKLDNSRCIICLPRKDYILIQTEKPAVPDEEINEAIKWKIGDLIPWDASEVTVDTYDSPEGGYAQTENTNVVVSKDHTIQKYVDLCIDCNLEIEAIEIAELSLGRLFSENRDLPDNIAVILFYKLNGIIGFYHKQALYLSRKIELGQDIFSAEEPDMAEQGHYERIALDLQRSLDHFEGTFNVGSIQLVLLMPDGKKSKYFADYLAQNLSLNIHNQSLLKDQWLALLENTENQSKPSALTAIASLLRLTDD